MSLLVLNTNKVETWESTPMDSRLWKYFTSYTFTDKPHRHDLYFGRIVEYKETYPRYTSTTFPMSVYLPIANIEPINAKFYGTLTPQFGLNPCVIPLITISIEMREPPDTRMSEFIYALMENGEI